MGDQALKCRLFRSNAEANSREIHEASAVPAGCGRKQPSSPRSVGCSSRTRKQTTERTAKCRSFRTNADANSRENREVSVVPAERGSKQPRESRSVAVPAGRRCKQPREPRSVGCSSRTQTQTADIAHEQRLFRHEISIRGRLFSERTIVGSSWR